MQKLKKFTIVFFTMFMIFSFANLSSTATTIRLNEQNEEKVLPLGSLDPGSTVEVLLGYDASGNEAYARYTISSWGYFPNNPSQDYLIISGHGVPGIGAPVMLFDDDAGTSYLIGSVQYIGYNGNDLDYALVEVDQQYNANISYEFTFNQTNYQFWDYARTDDDFVGFENNFYIRAGNSNQLINANYGGIYQYPNGNVDYYLYPQVPGNIQTIDGDSGSPVFYYDDTLNRYFLAGNLIGYNTIQGVQIYLFSPIWRITQDSGITPYTINTCDC